MKLDYLKGLYQKGLFEVHECFTTWEQAVRASVQPLVRAGMAEPAYADSIIDNVEENGPYIFLAPHICMPHSKAVELVHKPGNGIPPGTPFRGHPGKTWEGPE